MTTPRDPRVPDLDELSTMEDYDLRMLKARIIIAVGNIDSELSEYKSKTEPTAEETDWAVRARKAHFMFTSRISAINEILKARHASGLQKAKTEVFNVARKFLVDDSDENYAALEAAVAVAQEMYDEHYDKDKVIA